METFKNTKPYQPKVRDFLPAVRFAGSTAAAIVTKVYEGGFEASVLTPKGEHPIPGLNFTNEDIL